jgi:hypothetical protein
MVVTLLLSIHVGASNSCQYRVRGMRSARRASRLLLKASLLLKALLCFAAKNKCTNDSRQPGYTNRPIYSSVCVGEYSSPCITRVSYLLPVTTPHAAASLPHSNSPPTMPVTPALAFTLAQGGTSCTKAQGGRGRSTVPFRIPILVIIDIRIQHPWTRRDVSPRLSLGQPMTLLTHRVQLKTNSPPSHAFPPQVTSCPASPFPASKPCRSSAPMRTARALVR